MISRYHFVVMHGAYGDPSKNWFPWLSEQLCEHGATVSKPSFPTPEGQNLTKWLNEFTTQVGALQPHTVLVGHSAAVPFILRLLEQADTGIRAAFLVSGFVRFLGNERFDRVNSSFLDTPFDWERIRSNCQEFHVYNSDTDPYVPLECGEEIAQYLRTKLTVVHEGGHINSAAGYEKFDLLLDDILKSLHDDSFSRS